MADQELVDPPPLEVPPTEGDPPPPSAVVEEPPGPEAMPPAEVTPPRPGGAEVPKWALDRITKLSKQKQDLEAKLASEGTRTTPAAPPSADTVERRAAELSAINDFNRRCDETAAAGRKAFPDFDSRITTLRQLVDPTDQAEVANYNHLLDAAIETGQGAQILHSLSADPAEAQRLLSLSPTRRVVEITKMALKEAPTAEVKEISGAPRPITPVGGRGPSHTPIDPSDPERSDDIKDNRAWFARRQAQVTERRKDMPGLR